MRRFLLNSCFRNSTNTAMQRPEQNKRVWVLASQLEHAKREYESSAEEIKADCLRKLIRLTKEFNELVMMS